MNTGRRLDCLATTAVVLLAVLAPPARGETRTITFQQAVDTALDRNLSLLLTANRRGLDDVAVSNAFWRFFPNLSLGMSASRSFSKTQTAGGGTVWESGTSGSVGLSSSVTLFDGLANVSGLRQARFEQVAGELDYDRARQTVVFQVITNYLAFIEATEQMRVREENLSAQNDQLLKVRALVEEGERPVSDRYQQESAVAQARLALVEARRTLELSRVDLVQTLNFDPLEDIDFAIPPAADLEPGEGGATFASLVETAMRERADLSAETERVSSTGETLAQARADWWPTLSLSGNFSASYSDQADGDLFSQLDDRQSAGVGLSLSFPLFDRMQRRNAVRAATINLENAGTALEQLRQDVALQVRRAVLDRDAASESMSAATSRVEAARQALAYTNERYLAGASTLYEVTLARADLVSAESGEVSARYQLLWQRHLVEYYVGTLDPEAGLGW